MVLPTPTQQTGAEQAPYRCFPCGIGAPAAGDCLPCSSAGIPPRDTAMVETAGSPTQGCGCQGSILGRHGKGTLLGGSAEVTNQQVRRLSASSPSQRSVPLPAPSGKIYRLSKRSKMKATAPAAHWPRQEERASLPSPSPPTCLHLGEQDTPPVPPSQQQHLPLAPAFKG